MYMKKWQNDLTGVQRPVIPKPARVEGWGRAGEKRGRGGHGRRPDVQEHRTRVGKD